MSKTSIIEQVRFKVIFISSQNKIQVAYKKDRLLYCYRNFQILTLNQLHQWEQQELFIIDIRVPISHIIHNYPFYFRIHNYCTNGQEFQFPPSIYDMRHSYLYCYQIHSYYIDKQEPQFPPSTFGMPHSCPSYSQNHSCCINGLIIQASSINQIYLDDQHLTVLNVNEQKVNILIIISIHQSMVKLRHNPFLQNTNLQNCIVTYLTEFIKSICFTIAQWDQLAQFPHLIQLPFRLPNPHSMHRFA